MCNKIYVDNSFPMTELEVLNIVGAAAAILKARLNFKYGRRKDDDVCLAVSTRRYCHCVLWRYPFLISCATQQQQKPPRN